ncbi:MAG TPA: glycoside hydrolase family 9 protein, partial [Candidatus Acidoferrum sp.]|nr:glycoside hydrolase family 9 protein [Candidatus Acidoferrum sp.]
MEFIFHKRAIIWVALFCATLNLPATAQISPVSVPVDGGLRPAGSGMVIHVNQVAYDSAAPKFAVLETAGPLNPGIHFQLRDARTSAKVFEGTLADGQDCTNWFPGRYFYRLDFSPFQQPGHFRLHVEEKGASCNSFDFEIGKSLLETQTVPAIIGFFHHQRANSPQELEADRHLILFGSTNTVDLRGGWCDASGDVSKYFSHLAYANFMSPQQTPLVVWSMTGTADTAAPLLDRLQARRPLMDEALYGADYLMRSLSPDDYF